MWDEMREQTAARRHPHNLLTTRSVHHASAALGHQRRMTDGGGLYLLIAPNGSKSWMLRTIVKGKRSDIGLGSVTLVSLAEAREQAARLRKIARAGGDPLAERRHERRTVPTFESAAKSVHRAHSAAIKNEKHRKQWLSSLNDVIAAFGAKRVDAVTSADI